MKRTVIGLLAVLLLPLGVFAQSANNSMEACHAGVWVDNTTQVERLIKSAAAGQMRTEAELNSLLKTNRKYSEQLAQVIKQHRQLATLLRGEKCNEDFYPTVWAQLKDLAQAVENISDKGLARECAYLLDHTYFFAPIPERLYSISDVIFVVRQELENAGQDATADWTDFYRDFSGYIN